MKIDLNLMSAAALPPDDNNLACNVERSEAPAAALTLREQDLISRFLWAGDKQGALKVLRCSYRYHAKQDNKSAMSVIMIEANKIKGMDVERRDLNDSNHLYSCVWDAYFDAVSYGSSSYLFGQCEDVDVFTAEVNNYPAEIIGYLVQGLRIYFFKVSDDGVGNGKN